MTKQTYSVVANQNQLIDLNGQSVNFELSFSAKSNNGKFFEALVVDQKTLDSESNLEFREAKNGLISAKIVFNQNKYQNFFLVLKAPENCEIEVTIDKEELPIREEPPEPALPAPSQEVEKQKEESTLMNKLKIPDKFNWKLILTIIIVLVVLGLIWFYYFNGNKKVEESCPELLGPTTVSVSSKDSIPPFKPPVVEPTTSNTLLSKLNNLVVR